MAFAESLLPPVTYVNAANAGYQVSSHFLEHYHYQYLHMIGHSAGSNLIQTATSVLAPFAIIHQTFLDAYIPFANLVSNRHISGKYGSLATYVDNYVDTRSLVVGMLDTTDLHLTNGFNIDVTPADDTCGASAIVCRHSRPYRFYLKSIQGDGYDATYEGIDPVFKTGQMGFALSMEAENSMNLLKNFKDTACHMDDSGDCLAVAKPIHGTLYYLPGAIVDTTIDATVGTVNFVKGVGSKLFETLQFAVSIPTAISMAAPEGARATTATTPTATPAWLVTQVTTTAPTNTLRFNWRYTSGGEGLLRVFVNENLVSQLDQRFLPLASTQPESIFVGELPAGIYRIAFRLDGYGANPSGVELTGVELGRQTLVLDTFIGVFRAGSWFLDANGNGVWDGCQQEGGLDLCLFGSFGQGGDLPAASNWNDGAKSSIGVLRSGTGEWFIDLNGNHQWDGCGADGCYAFGQAGDLPVAGDWTGTGFAKIGVFRNGQWYLDANGNGAWDGCGADRCFAFGQFGDLPVAGNWTGGSTVGVGVFRAGTWYLDYNGNGAWDGCQQDGGQDQCLYHSFGMAGDLPVVGDWNGDGKAKVGVFRKGTWYLDDNGNGAWDGCDVDRCYVGSFGAEGDWPVAGKW